MIETNISNLAAAATRQDVRSLQDQREGDSLEQAEQASSNPLAASGVEAAAAARVAVSSQPASVVTRLGETSEQVPLYEADRPAGTIIRPAIELAQTRLEAASAQSSTQEAVADTEATDAREVTRDTATAVGAATTARQDTSFAEMQKLV